MGEIRQELLEILACPECKGDVRMEGGTPLPPEAGGSVTGWIVCQNPACGLRFPIRDGIPIMLVEEAGREGGETVDIRP